MTLGMLVVAPRGREVFRYPFTPADVVWLGRLLAAASGGQHRGRRRAILWNALARFGASGRTGLSLAAFIERHEPSLPRVSWRQLPPGARRLALAVGTGVLRRRNPNATVHVSPRGAASPAGSSYGPGPSPYGSSGEFEFEDTPPAAAPEATPSTGAASAAPPGSSAAPPEEPAAAMPDAGADLTAGSPDEPPPMPDEPMPEPPTFDTQDGNKLRLNPDLLRRLMRAYRRRQGRWPQPGLLGYPYGGSPSGGAGYPGYRYGGAPYAGNRYGGSPYGGSPYRAPYSAYPRWRAPLPGSPVTRTWGGRAAPWVGAAPSRPWPAQQSLVGRLQRLAQGARRVGSLRSIASGRRYPVFGGRLRGRNYRIVTRPRGLHHEIMLVRNGELQQELAS